jgi:8-oxo-dGTP pyrophosphatase MutT (NUDIX family)
MTPPAADRPPERTSPASESPEPSSSRSAIRARRVDSVSVVIEHPQQPGRILIVHRPPDDADLPNAWGLPAASLRRGESHQDAARRAARDKLGIDVDIGRERARGAIRRGDTLLFMRLFDARIRSGLPHVPQAVPGETQNTDWRWDALESLRPAAERGSLCCRLALGGYGVES